MKQKVLDKLENNLYKRYKSLSNSFLFVENYSGFIVLNWSCLNDGYINYKKVELIKNYMYSFLKKNKQEGFFYVGDSAILIK